MLAAILVLTLLVRGAAIVATGPSTLRFGDAQDYVDTAAVLCDEGRYPDRGSLPFFRAPGLPFFLAAATACQPRRVLVAKLALAACDVATAALVFCLTLSLGGPGRGARGAALLAAVLWAVDPFATLASSDVTTEPLATVLLAAALCALLRARDGAHASIRAAAGGVALGLATLTRPGSLAVAPLWLLLPALASARPARARASALLAGALGLVATLAPWTIRNQLHFGEPILVNDAGGYNAWRGTHPRLHEMLSSTGAGTFAADSRVLEQDLARLAREQDLGSEASPRARDARWWAAARANVIDDPARGARIVARNALAFFRPWLDPAAYGKRTVLVSAAWFVPLGALALGGLVLVWRRDRATAVLLAAGVVFAGLAHVPFQTVLRFRLPFTEPLLLALAATSAVAVLERLRRSPAGAALRPR